jgi:hypothetical protein
MYPLFSLPQSGMDRFAQHDNDRMSPPEFELLSDSFDVTA